MDFRRNNDNDELFDSNKYYNEKEIIDWYSNNNFPKDSEGDILHLPHIRIIPRWKEVDKFGEIYTPSYDEINFLFKKVKNDEKRSFIVHNKQKTLSLFVLCIY